MSISQAFIENQEKIIRQRLARYSRMQRPDSSETAERASYKMRIIVPKLQAALELIESGKYGNCIDCGEVIDITRLKKIPAALRCLDCQTEIEKKENFRKR